MGRLMGSSNSNNYGEQIFINKASEYLDDTNIIYWNRQLFGKEFDVCILMPEKGILVVELKGWREENILRIENNDSVIIQTNDGEVSASPQKQARGYRFSIERHIRQNIGKFPLVYQMVCLPQVSKAFFKSHRLDVVMEEKFTILKEDLKDNTSFFNKLDQALREVCHWNRDPFDRRTMLEVRNLFETDINVDEDGESEIEKELASSYHRHDYSRFYYFNEFDQMSGNTINDMVAQYLHGCKLYCVFSKKAQMLAVIKALDTALTQRGLVRNRDNIEIAFDEQKSHTPLAESVGDMFMGFHCSMSVLSAPFDKNTTSFAIPNGSYSSAQKRILEKLSEQSQFNFEQYQVEHATPEKNIVIRAGAGTGKTYTMISRIGFICYTQNVPLQKMADRIVMILDYKLFLVGDIKQCIYRFRGAKEKAFDQLGIAENPDKWLEFSLQRNYRTDKHLLDIFDRSFTKWGKLDEELLTYDEDKDRLIGTQDYNGKYLTSVNRFYRRLPTTSEEMRIPILVEEIKRIQKRIQYEESHGMKLSAKEKSIAILVRENWQADMIRTDCARLGISVHTNTGGDLYMSQPAIDMLTLVNALVHFDEADYLHNLVTSNFFNLDIPKSNLYEIRMKIRTGGWRAKTDEKEQVNYLINFMNLMLSNTVDKNNKWEYIVASLRTQPILQAIRKVYNTLEPWKHFSNDPWKQHYYQLNVDLLFEQIINACNVDRLTINTLQEHLHNSIVSQVSVDSRTPAQNEEETAIQCITVHKSKGLEYGHVIMPFCSASMDFIKRTQLQISTTNAARLKRIQS